MSYIGNTLQNQNYVPAIDYFNGDGSTVAFTLSRPVASVAAVQATISNVPQNPGSAFTVLNSTITFTSAPPAGTANIYVYYTSPNTSVATISQAPVIIGPEYVSINNAAALGGTTNPIVAMSGSANNYVQSYVYNTANNAYSSADFVAYPSNGVDSSGWVDMGITGPSYSQAAYSVTGANEAYLFGSAPSAAGATGNLVIATDSTGSANSIQLYTNGFTKSKSAYAMQIDKNGNVTMPGQPAFFAYNRTSGTSSATIICNTTLLNNGSYYSTSTGRFTCPVAGMYEFEFGTLYQGSSVGRFFIQKNGADLGDTNCNQLRLDATATGSEIPYGFKTIIVSASASDYFTVYYVSDDNVANAASGGYTTFAGKLLA